MTKGKVIRNVIVCLYFLLLSLTFSGFWQGGIVLSEISLNRRRLGLLVNSIGLAGISAVGCVLIGMMAAMYIHNSRLRNSLLRWFVLLLAPVPYYVYALMWMYLIRFLGHFERNIYRYAASGLAPCIFANTMSFLPLTTGLILGCMEQQDKQPEDMAYVYAKGNRVFTAVVLPQIRPTLIAAGALVFVLSITDFSVPSLFQYQTYTLEIFSEYSRGGGLGNIGLLSLPLVIPVLLILCVIAKGLRSIPVKRGEQGNRGYRISGMWKVFAGLCVLVAVLQVTAPFCVFLAQMGDISAFMDSLSLCGEELLTSAVISLIAAVLAAVMAPMPAWWLQDKKLWVWMLALLPMAVPSSLIGMGLLSAVNGSAIHFISGTIFFPAMGCMIKYIPFAILIYSARIRRLHREEIDMARVYRQSEFQCFRRFWLPLFLPTGVCAAAVVFLLTLGEEGIGLILMPPGYQTIAVKIYSYLHYGASELVSGFCLLTVMITAVLLMLVIKLTGRKKKSHLRVKSL